ncbi:MAG: rRNA pseudouridine synthase [Muribaculaceae bacterium]|nr:rRNA pseudouridine synthase [Muribaculaceae bacterium]
MDTENINGQGEKKPKRPRIGSQPAAEASGSHAHYDRHSSADNSAPRNYERPAYPRRPPFQPHDNAEGAEGQDYRPRYQNNRYGQDGANSYPRRNNGYQQNSYPRRNYDYNRAPQQNAEGTEGGENTYQQRYPRQNQGYQPRYNNNRGYNNNRYGNSNGGYNNRYGNGNNGGYNNNRYNSNRPDAAEHTEGENTDAHSQGYQPRYNNNRGYNNRGGYQNNRYGNNGGPGRYNQGARRPGGHQGGAFPARGKSFTPRPKRIEYEQPVPDPNEEIRLNKYMSNAGICSRREADEFIQQGLVKVNGQVVTELGTKITAKDVVEYDEKVVTLESKCYILLNKPKDCVTTSDDPNGRLTVMDLVKGACNERIYPVGRLDRNTTGVLLLTNDGDLASKLTHPKYVKKKIYHVWTDKDISEDDMQRIADGIELEDGPIHADAISYATETDRNQAGIEIHSGRNRIVRRIFESLGYHVTKLDRVYFAGLTKKNLPRGRWRYLTQEEVNYLKMGSFE